MIYLRARCWSIFFLSALLSLLFVPLASADLTGSLTITSQPPGALVLIDGAPQEGATPVNVSNVPSGQHQVNLTLPEYHDWSVSQYVSAGQNSVVTAALVPVLKNGILIVTSRPEPASVYVDGTYRGITPLTLDAGAGTHQLTVTATGYDPAIATAEVPEGGSFSIELQLNQTPTTGSLAIGGVPPNAAVVIDGVGYGNADHLIEALRPGSHQLLLKADGYQQFQTDITITAGRTLSLNVTLTPLLQKGSLNVTSVPPGASVMVDGVYRGLAPLVVPDLSAGTHQLIVGADGYNDLAISVQIRAGEELPYTARLVQRTATTGATSGTRTPGQQTAATQAATGDLRVSTTPVDVNITVDGVFRGVGPQTIRNLPAGTHLVVLSRAGYQDLSRSVTVTDGPAVVLEATLTRIGMVQAGVAGTGSASSSPEVPTTTRRSGPAEAPLLLLGLLIVGLLHRRGDPGT